jgi:DNA-binding transcriptional LysR family regulator
MTEATTPTRFRSRLRVRQLATLVAIADAGSLRKAAATLSVSQPALSKSLRDLEESVGRPLFARTRQGLAPTPHGNAVIDYARRLLRGVDALAITLDAIDRGAGGRLRIGVIPNVSSDWLRGVATRLMDGEPPIALQITESATDGLLDSLRRGQLDCVVGRITPANAGRDVAWRPVFEQTLRIVVRQRHPLLRHGTRLKLAHLAGCDWLLPPASTPTRQLLDHVFLEAGLPAPQTRLETYALPVIESFVGNGDLLAAVPDDIAQQFERRGSIRALPFRWPMPPICLAWLAGDEPNPLIRRFESASTSAKGSQQPQV